MKITILGDVPSKSNGYKLGNGAMFKDPKVKAYEKSFEKQMLQYRYKTIEGDYAVTMHVYYKDRRKDVGNADKVIGDLLQKTGVIKNDRYCQEQHIYRHIDKDTPRIEIEITAL